MNKKVKQQILDYLTDTNDYGVQCLIDNFDFLCTGSDSRWADKQQKAAQEQLDAIIKLIKDS